ncbi:hypothetical protein [Hymenobacter mucosus]|uniref:Uncharacterized protein n=1 Tax=Hymenobacter mucosus TaxID=1411120 RepID=A0A238V827_9BACT|nr:hypothetical protein [Hymenobacter mucosus]SNR29793.1 hypothetical protein SAMN06269173_101197 [Hymenobacter mucosus]
MPKTIDYPRTSYTSAWEVAEVVDDTGGKCAIETAARKLSRKVSGSFKAIIGSAVKFGLLTSKREFLTTTNLFRRIKHAYDKQEEKIYHREAFLHPPLFTQICRKFRNRELPVHMLDVMLIREFAVEEINAQSVAKAFVDGARMVDILDERNVIADIDQLAAQQTPRRDLASSEMPLNLFKGGVATPGPSAPPETVRAGGITLPQDIVPTGRQQDAVSSLFGLDTDDLEADNDDTSEDGISSSDTLYSTPPAPAGPDAVFTPPSAATPIVEPRITASPPVLPLNPPVAANTARPMGNTAANHHTGERVYTIQISGPGVDTQLSVQDVDDLAIVGALLEKIRRQLTR